MKFIAAIDLGGHNIRVSLADEEGSIIAESSGETDRHAQGPEENIDRLVALVDDVRNSSAAAGPIHCLSLGVPGVVNQKTGTVVQVPNVPHWEDLPIRRILAEHFDVPVLVENDVNLAARGEFWRGAAQGCPHFFFIAFGTGIGGGIFINGAPYSGAHFSAGEIGYLVLDSGRPDRRMGDLGWFESVASGLALDDKARRASKEHPESALARAGGESGPRSSDLFILAEEGDSLSQEILDSAFDVISAAVVNVVALLDPEVIVVGGGMSAQGERLLQPVRARAEQYGLPIPPLRVSELGQKAQLFGAIHAGLVAEL